MSDDRQSHDNRERHERFEAALDDLFGPAEAPSNPDPIEAAPAPAVPPEAVTASPISTIDHAPSYPNPAPPYRKRRSIASTIGIGCAVVVGIVFFCIIALLVIGLIAGDDTSAALQTVPMTVS